MTSIVEAQDKYRQGINPDMLPISIGHGIFPKGGRSRIIRNGVDALPSATTAATLFEDRIRLEDRRDVETPIIELSMTPSGHVTRGSGVLSVSPESLGQLLSRTSFPEPMAAATYLATIPAERRAKEFNEIVREHAGDKVVVLRHRRNILEDNTACGRGIYAAVSTRYVIHDAHEAIRHFVNEMSAYHSLEGLKMSVLSDGIRSEAFIHYRNAGEGPEEHSAYFRFTTGDGGKHSHQGEHGVMRLVCKNGLTIFDRSVQHYARHTGDHSIHMVDGMARNGNKALESFFKQWAVANSTSIYDMVDSAPSNLTEEEMVRGVYRGLLKDTELTIPGYRGEKAVDELFNAWTLEQSPTKAGIVNGITRTAHESDLLSMWSADDIQAAAGKILASTRKVHFATL